MQTKNKLRICEFCISEIVTCAESCICVFVHSADLRFLHLENNLRCRFAHFVHDGFSHICRFVSICARQVLSTCAEVCEHVEKCFCDMCSICENVFAEVCANM